MPRVKFLRENTELDVPERANLRREALRAKIELYPAFSKYVNCRGNSLCGKCAVLIKDGKQNCSPKGFREKLRLMLSYLPIGREDFRERLSDCLASLHDPNKPAEKNKNKKGNPDPFWTWFLPNQLEKPKR